MFPGFAEGKYPENEVKTSPASHQHPCKSTAMLLWPDVASDRRLRYGRPMSPFERQAKRKGISASGPVGPEKQHLPGKARKMLRFADLVVMAGRLHPFPFRTRP